MVRNPKTPSQPTAKEGGTSYLVTTFSRYTHRKAIRACIMTMNTSPRMTFAEDLLESEMLFESKPSSMGHGGPCSGGKIANWAAGQLQEQPFSHDEHKTKAFPQLHGPPCKVASSRVTNNEGVCYPDYAKSCNDQHDAEPLQHGQPHFEHHSRQDSRENNPCPIQHLS